jgi:prevent-host-death family protein
MFMVRIGIKKLRDHLSEYLRKVRQGERITITDRGQPIAEISPLVDSENINEKMMSLIREGKATWGGGHPEGLRNPPDVQGGSVSEIVLDERD